MFFNNRRIFRCYTVSFSEFDSASVNLSIFTSKDAIPRIIWRFFGSRSCLLKLVFSFSEPALFPVNDSQEVAGFC
jgi:hypothetical protein